MIVQYASHDHAALFVVVVVAIIHCLSLLHYTAAHYSTFQSYRIFPTLLTLLEYFPPGHALSSLGIIITRKKRVEPLTSSS